MFAGRHVSVEQFIVCYFSVSAHSELDAEAELRQELPNIVIMRHQE